MKNPLSPYQEAERLVQANALIDIANLIANNERLLEALKIIKKALIMGCQDTEMWKICDKAIKQAEEI